MPWGLTPPRPSPRPPLRCPAHGLWTQPLHPPAGRRSDLQPSGPPDPLDRISDQKASAQISYPRSLGRKRSSEIKGMPTPPARRPADRTDLFPCWSDAAAHQRASIAGPATDGRWRAVEDGRHWAAPAEESCVRVTDANASTTRASPSPRSRPQGRTSCLLGPAAPARPAAVGSSGDPVVVRVRGAEESLVALPRRSPGRLALVGARPVIVEHPAEFPGRSAVRALHTRGWPPAPDRAALHPLRSRTRGPPQRAGPTSTAWSRRPRGRQPRTSRPERGHDD